MLAMQWRSRGPDRDDDGYTDDIDQCPDLAGVGPDGCPVDLSDADGDGVEDALDECPDVPGAFVSEGCPDGDLDGVPDEQDICPDEIGAAESGSGVGCPDVRGDDRDGDGVADSDDACPDEPGAVVNNGCPAGADAPSAGGAGGDEAATIDSDGDGLVDESDACPFEAGPLENNGCPVDAGGGVPAPGSEGDSDGDGIPDGEESSEGLIETLDFLFGGLQITNFVEFQALDFQVNEAYDEVYCYASLTQDPPDHYGPFNFVGERYWDITEYMGSLTVGVPGGESLPVMAECYGYSGAPGSSDFHFIGRYTALHPESDWDGHVITAIVSPVDQPVGSAEANTEGFQATYRICSGSCDSSALPAPYLSRQRIAGQEHLLWSWRGDYSTIDSFKVYINGSHRFSVRANTNLTSIDDYVPICGVRNTFELTASIGDRESPRSNPVVLQGQPCDRKVRVTFDRIYIHGMADEDRNGQIGPVFGNFWAQGSETGDLRFNGNDYPHGITINSGGGTSVASLFNTIHAQLDHPCSGLSCRDYSAPEVNFVEIEVAPDTDLTVGAAIYDRDWHDTDTIIRAEETIPFDDIQPGHHVLRSGSIEVTYWIDMVVAADVGDAPDLRVTEVTREAVSGQIRAWVTNMGGSIMNQSIRLDYYDLDTGDILESLNMEDVSIGTGEGRWFQSVRTDVPIYGIRAWIDPDNRIAESNDDNNVYTAPVLLVVSLEQIQATYCEFFVSQYTENSYEYSVGYGLDTENITWVADRLRYPAAGYMRYDRWLTEEENLAHPAIEDSRFNVPVPIPDGNNLYIRMTGWENDAFSDDFLGLLFVTINPEEYINADGLTDHRRSEGISTTTCTDGEPIGPDFFGFTAWWQVSRLE